MRPFDEVMTLLKQGKVKPGFGNSPFPLGGTPMQSPARLNRKLRGVRGNRPETLRTTPMRELVQDNVIDPDTGEYIPDFLEDGSPNPAAGPTATIKSMRPFDHAWMILKDENATAKKAIIDCLKREGGAASVGDCAKACGLSNAKCKKLIASMDNVKIHKHGDAILMDGL